MIVRVGAAFGKAKRDNTGDVLIAFVVHGQQRQSRVFIIHDNFAADDGLDASAKTSAIKLHRRVQIGEVGQRQRTLIVSCRRFNKRLYAHDRISDGVFAVNAKVYKCHRGLLLVRSITIGFISGFCVVYMGSLGRKSLCRKCSIEQDIIALFAVDSYSFGGCHKKQPVFAGRC